MFTQLGHNILWTRISLWTDTHNTTSVSVVTLFTTGSSYTTCPTGPTLPIFPGESPGPVAPLSPVGPRLAMGPRSPESPIKPVVPEGPHLHARQSPHLPPSSPFTKYISLLLSSVAICRVVTHIVATSSNAYTCLSYARMGVTNVPSTFVCSLCGVNPST